MLPSSSSNCSAAVSRTLVDACRGLLSIVSFVFPSTAEEDRSASNMVPPDFTSFLEILRSVCRDVLITIFWRDADDLACVTSQFDWVCFGSDCGGFVISNWPGLTVGSPGLLLVKLLRWDSSRGCSWLGRTDSSSSRRGWACTENLFRRTSAGQLDFGRICCRQSRS